MISEALFEIAEVVFEVALDVALVTFCTSGCSLIRLRSVINGTITIGNTLISVLMSFFLYPMIHENKRLILVEWLKIKFSY